MEKRISKEIAKHRLQLEWKNDVNLRQLEHVATSLPHRCHLGDNGQVVNNKANLKPILGNQCTESERRADLRFLVACEGLGVTKKSKSSDVRGCVCVVLVHQPVNARLVFSIGLFVSF